ALDGSPAFAAGAGNAGELAVVLANGAEWLRRLAALGVDVPAAAAQTEFTISADADVFAVVAKCRALRTCWARMLEACGCPEAAAASSLHVVVATAMLSRQTPRVNMLRATTACFGAAAGGADAVTIPPFDVWTGADSELGRRVARNTHLILRHEAHACAVVDPAGGSWFAEALTESLAQAAWQRFTQIEAAGGIVPTLADGSLRAGFAETAARRDRAIATRRQVLVGVNEFAEPAEPLDPDGGGAGTADGGRRWAAPFEELRLAAAAAQPRVFLATLGPPSEHSSRAEFAGNLFEAGGIAALVPDSGCDTAAEAAAAFARSGAALACICSDEQHHAAAATALRSAGAARVYVAGAPGDDEQQLRAAGVDEFVMRGCDALAVLRGAHDVLGLRGGATGRP
ncbi:MAG TPA: methylmalonyl-CoA mutase, partial [Acidimicrobiaceae bacterium]|nr:methylmalonyl-CoA mutase [Acidimicrobiaceae bacterium]